MHTFIVIQLNDPLIIEHQLKWTNKLRNNLLGESSKYDMRRISWKFRYLCQPLCQSVDLLDKKCHIFTGVLGYAIPGKFLEYFLECSDDGVTHIEHIININLELGYPFLIKPVQCLILLLHPFDKSRI